MPTRAMIFAPTGPGSLGDEAMIESLSTRLEASGYTVDVMTPFAAADSWRYLANVRGEVAFPSGGAAVAGWQLLRLLRNYSCLYVIGADVLDGHYEDRSVKRLLFCASLASIIRCKTTIVGFSYNARPSLTSVRLFRLLPRRVRVLLRDPVSLARFRRITGRVGGSSADVAFLLDPAESPGPGATAAAEWVACQRAQGRKVIVFNAGGASYAPDQGQPLGDTISRLYAAEISDVLRERSDVSMILMPHDHREVMQEHQLLRSIEKKLDAGFSGRVTSLLSDELRASEVKALFKQVDLVCTSRMHMAIAAFGAGTPPSSITYQDKFTGLYDLFSLDGPLMTLDESLKHGALRRFIEQGIDNAPCLSQKIQDRLPEVIELAERNLGV